MTTSQPLPPNDWRETELPLTPCAAAFPARTSASQERAPGLPGNDPACGVNMHDSFASYDPVSSSWKTSQRSLVADLETYSETFPRSGMMLSGIAYQQAPLAPLTAATGSGLLPTPEASNTKAVALRSGGRSPRNYLGPLWPTPRASDGPKGSRSMEGAMAELERTGSPDLPTAVKMWPTPSASDDRDRGCLKTLAIKRRHEAGKQLMLSMVVSEESGQLNPQWVEWLMGFPPGWTAPMKAGKPSRKTRPA